MYKIVILDLDGTLLTSDKRISESNKKIINELSDHIKFVFASARAFTTIKPYIEEINLLNEKSDKWIEFVWHVNEHYFTVFSNCDEQTTLRFIENIRISQDF